jgi:hypothetical protein
MLLWGKKTRAHKRCPCPTKNTFGLFSLLFIYVSPFLFFYFIFHQVDIKSCRYFIPMERQNESKSPTHQMQKIDLALYANQHPQIIITSYHKHMRFMALFCCLSSSSPSSVNLMYIPIFVRISYPSDVALPMSIRKEANMMDHTILQ